MGAHPAEQLMQCLCGKLPTNLMYFAFVLHSAPPASEPLWCQGIHGKLLRHRGKPLMPTAHLLSPGAEKHKSKIVRPNKAAAAAAKAAEVLELAGSQMDHSKIRLWPVHDRFVIR